MAGRTVALATLLAGSISIAADTVHVWIARLSDLAGDSARHEASLSTDELARADRFHFPADRRRFVLARGVLRALLGRYLHVEPHALRFTYGPQGKPALVPRPGWPDMHFNLSHARDMAVYAIGNGRAVGIDIEATSPTLDVLGVARQTFAPAELQALSMAPSDQQADLFFTFWVRKEALIKAHGGGISLDLNRIDVSTLEQLAVVDGRPALGPTVVPGHGRYFLWDLAPQPGYAASCAVAGPEPPVNIQTGVILPANDATVIETRL